jgi:hypothetical protein
LCASMELQSWEDERDAQDEHHALHLFAARVTFSQNIRTVEQHAGAANTIV